MTLDWFLSIHYPIQFQKGKKVTQALINFGNKVNVIIPAYASILGVRV